ncbi:MAG: replicative DNA helicase [Candidatus Eremiobacteraeota bacterium]|nr:replicative DNA helicase [Candidatus Eremiobacteraeota bacterium]
MSKTSQEFASLHIPPHNIEAEQACLGACLIDPEALDRISEVLSGPDDFYRESHQDIYRALVALAEKNQNVDLITACNQLRDMEKLESCGGPAYLDSLVSMVQSSAHVTAYATIVAERATERRLQQAGTAITRIALDGDLTPATKVDQAEELVFAVADRRRNQQLEQIKPQLEATFEELYERYQNQTRVTGVSTGFRDLDELTAGLQKSNLIIVAARPAMGKTAFCLSLAQNVVLNKDDPRVVAVFSLEMSTAELCQRVLCSVAQVNAMDVRRGNLRDNEWQRITRAMNLLTDAPLYIDDTAGITPLEMKAKCRRLQKRHGLDLIIIDYLQLMRGSGKIENRVQEISAISRQLKMLAKELNIPVIALSQVGRGVEARQDKRPSLSDLRESGAIEQDADVVTFIYRDEYYNPHTEDVGVAEVIIAKQRNGPVDTVKLSFVKRFAAFRNLESALEAPPPSPFVKPPGDEAFVELEEMPEIPL